MHNLIALFKAFKFDALTSASSLYMESSESDYKGSLLKCWDMVHLVSETCFSCDNLNIKLSLQSLAPHVASFKPGCLLRYPASPCAPSAPTLWACCAHSTRPNRRDQESRTPMNETQHSLVSTAHSPGVLAGSDTQHYMHHSDGILFLSDQRNGVTIETKEH